jgi:hypothetical protein
VNLSFESIPALVPLAEVSRRQNVRLTIRGSLVRRLVRTAISDSADSMEGGLYSHDLLFRLTPFLSDIDVEHSGPPELNSTIHDELVSSVPAASAIRLEVRSEDESKPFLEAKKFQAFAPILSLSLSSDGFHDPDGGAVDVAELRYRFRANSRYPLSPLYRSGRDLEVFGMLVFLKAVLEDGARTPDDFVANLELAAKFADAVQSAYLRARLLYLLAGIKGSPYRMRQNPELATSLKVVDRLWQKAQESLTKRQIRSGTLNPRRLMIVSAWLGNNTFRFPLIESIPRIGVEPTGASSMDKMEIVSGQRCIAVSKWLKLSPGVSDCTIKRAAHGLEFVHLLLRTDGLGKLPSEEYITACWVFKGQPRTTTAKRDKRREHRLIFPAPTVCHVFRQGTKQMLSVRSNLLDLGSLFVELKSVTVKVFILCVDGL